MTDGSTPPPQERAYAVETYVERRHGQWEVDIVVIFEDEVVHRTVNSFRDERRARIAADWMKRAAQREIWGPVNG